MYTFPRDTSKTKRNRWSGKDAQCKVASWDLQRQAYDTSCLEFLTCFGKRNDDTGGSRCGRCLTRGCGSRARSRR